MIDYQRYAQDGDEGHRGAGRRTTDDAPGQDFLDRVRRSANTVLANSPTGRQVLDLCEDHAQARRMITEDRSGGSTVVAVIGATGQGKSWLVRQMIKNPSAAKAIRSGNRLDEATNMLVWVGPRPPADLDPQYEQYIHCSEQEMISIGTPYLLLDTPGSTDARGTVSAVAARALSLASVLLLVVRRDQLRSEVVGLLAEASEGSIVIPVVNATRKRDDILDADVDSIAARIRQDAPTSVVDAPIIIDDFELSEQSETEVGNHAAMEVSQRLQEKLETSWHGDRRHSTRLAALDGRFRAALHSVLSDQLPGLTAAVGRLNREATLLPTEIAESLVGPGGPLRAAIRSRLRLALLTNTAAIWFPYRSILSLLNLTHGAWDRVLMSFSGSLPSLVSAVWTSTKNLTADQGAQRDVRDGLQRRSAAAVADRLGPLANRFRDELAELGQSRATHPAIDRDDSRSQVAYLAGIDTLQESSQKIFDAEVERVAVSPTIAFVCGLVGTAVFWTFMAGPVVALYHGYLSASYEAISEFGGELERFPKPEFSLFITSFLLSLFPAAAFAMAVLTVAQGRWRVSRAESRIRDMHHETIERLQREGVLRLRWDEPLLDDAEFLLSAGSSETESSI